MIAIRLESGTTAARSVTVAFNREGRPSWLISTAKALARILTHSTEGRLDPNGGTGTQNPMNQKQKRQQAGDEEQNRAARQHPGHGNISEGQARGFSKCSTPSRAQPFYNPEGMMRNDKVGLGRLASARRIP